MPDGQETKKETKKKETSQKVSMPSGEIKRRCFNFRGKTKCVNISTHKKGPRPLEVEIPVFTPTPNPSFEIPAIRPRKVQTGTRKAFVTRETLKKLKKKKIGVKRVRE